MTRKKEKLFLYLKRQQTKQQNLLSSFTSSNLQEGLLERIMYDTMLKYFLDDNLFFSKAIWIYTC